MVKLIVRPSDKIPFCTSIGNLNTYEVPSRELRYQLDEKSGPMGLSPKNKDFMTQGQGAAISITSRPEYLAAARQAIDQLGETANRGELLKRAESIFETTRQKPVDI